MEERAEPIGTKTIRATRRACSTIPRILRALLPSIEFQRLKRDCWCEKYACRSISSERNNVRSARSLGASYRRDDSREILVRAVRYREIVDLATKHSRVYAR